MDKSDKGFVPAILLCFFLGGFGAHRGDGGKGGTGIRMEGTDGWLDIPAWRRPLQASSPKILNSVIGPDETHLFTCPQGEHRNFLDCVKSRKDPYFPVEVGHAMATLMLRPRSTTSMHGSTASMAWSTPVRLTSTVWYQSSVL